MTSNTPNWQHELESAIHAIPSRFAPNELAYLALTSKPEAQIRDAIAVHLHEAFGSSAGARYLVAREWGDDTHKGFYDLAVVDTAATQRRFHHPPAMLVELKAHYTFNFQKGIPNKAMRVAIKADLDGLVKPIGYPLNQRCQDGFFIHILVTPMKPVDERHWPLVKYHTHINRLFRKVTDPEVIRTTGTSIAAREVKVLALGGYSQTIALGVVGEAFGIPVAVDIILLSTR